MNGVVLLRPLLFVLWPTLFGFILNLHLERNTSWNFSFALSSTFLFAQQIPLRNVKVYVNRVRPDIKYARCPYHTVFTHTIRTQGYTIS